MNHGPFPIRFGRLLFGLAVAVLCLLAGVFLGTPETVRCGARSEECTFEGPFGRTLRFPRSALLRVSVKEVRGSKGGRMGEPTLELATASIRLRQVEPDRAGDFARAVNAALEGPAPFELALRMPWIVLVVFGALSAMALGLVYTALRGIGRYRLGVNADRRELTVERRILGIPIERATVSTTGAIDVEVEWGRDRDFFHSRHEVGDTQARLSIVTADGERRPLCSSFHRGYNLHREAANELHALLACPPRSAAQQVRLDEDAALFRPPNTAFQNMGRLPLTWIGMCCGSLAGLALYAVGGLLLGFLHARDPVDGLAMFVGAGGGSVGGILLAFHLARPRDPR